MRVLIDPINRCTYSASKINELIVCNIRRKFTFLVQNVSHLTANTTIKAVTTVYNNWSKN